MKKNSFEIYNEIKKLDLLKDSPKFWWPDAGRFEVIVGAVLTQNTTWINVEKSLQNLKYILTLEKFVNIREKELKKMIQPSGFYNQKAPRLLKISHNIQNDFLTFENFQTQVTREWLLKQKGIGEESADAILCYACLRDEMVVDTYTKRLLSNYGISFKKYVEYKNFLESDFRVAFNKSELPLLFARYHGMIVEYNKKFKL